ncbi:ribosome silencing factor [Leptospira sp. GIMC2001]|uniref:ribosome silencing factor n=1 Tax=Leptospira sp. GIMC2001 TaxID=1513297 RepID=UPI00234B80E2|nr:ribosome silencing factor [Leptospira sp. GIMC2001]WCL47963.1 ribosome silencing factor [Leptospira sp. GIMC2001]
MIKQSNKNSDVIGILKEIKRIFVEKKCDDMQFLDLQDVNSYLTYFAIATAKTNTQARSAARDIDKYMKPLRKGKGIQNHQLPSNAVGKDSSGWLLLDYGDILVHIMEPDIRTYYDLERLWGDANFLSLED